MCSWKHHLRESERDRTEMRETLNSNTKTTETSANPTSTEGGIVFQRYSA